MDPKKGKSAGQGPKTGPGQTQTKKGNTKKTEFVGHNLTPLAIKAIVGEVLKVQKTGIKIGEASVKKKKTSTAETPTATAATTSPATSPTAPIITQLPGTQSSGQKFGKWLAEYCVSILLVLVLLAAIVYAAIQYYNARTGKHPAVQVQTKRTDSVVRLDQQAQAQDQTLVVGDATLPALNGAKVVYLHNHYGNEQNNYVLQPNGVGYTTPNISQNGEIMMPKMVPLPSYASGQNQSGGHLKGEPLTLASLPPETLQEKKDRQAFAVGGYKADRAIRIPNEACGMSADGTGSVELVLSSGQYLLIIAPVGYMAEVSSGSDLVSINCRGDVDAETGKPVSVYHIKAFSPDKMPLTIRIVRAK